MWNGGLIRRVNGISAIGAHGTLVVQTDGTNNSVGVLSVVKRSDTHEESVI